MSLLLVGLVLFLAILVQSISGFGGGLIAMSLLPSLLPRDQAVSLVALSAICLETLLVLRHRRSLQIGSVIRVAVASLIGIPIGIVLFDLLPAGVISKFFGLFIISYSVYALFNLRLPTIHNPRWGYVFGFAGGLMTGMYNAGGPPLVIYGTAREWTPDEFRGNLQGIFVTNSVLVVTTHVLRQHYTPEVLHYALAIPFALVVGFFIGGRVSPFIPPTQFRRMVFILLLLLGVRLLLS
jgi:uncharacterized protein